MRPDDLREPVKETVTQEELAQLYRAAFGPSREERMKTPLPPKPITYLEPAGYCEITKRDEDWSKAGHEIH